MKKENKEENKKQEQLGVENDINVKIRSKEDGILFDQDCCTVINIILNNDGEIATSFLGIHNENIIKELYKAQKIYFKALMKTLKDECKKAKSMLDFEEQQKKDTEAKENNPHVSSYTPSEDKETSKTIDTDSKPYNHECDDKGNLLIKKRIDLSNDKNSNISSNNKTKIKKHSNKTK